jgi:hypothetical protein
MKGRCAAVVGTCEPRWDDAEFVFDVWSRSQIAIAVRDEQSFGEAVVGFCFVNLRELKSEEMVDRRIELSHPVAPNRSHWPKLRWPKKQQQQQQADEPTASFVYPTSWLNVSFMYTAPESIARFRSKLHDARAAWHGRIRQRREKLGRAIHLIDGVPKVGLNASISQIKTGDIALLHGREHISRAIELATASYWSHVALFVRSPSPEIRALYQLDKFDDMARRLAIRTLQETDDVYVFESDTSILDGREGGGVQLAPFRLWYADYHRTVGASFAMVIRPLIPPATLVSRGLLKQADFPDLQLVLGAFCGVPYATSKRELIGSLKGLNKSEELTSVFCSQIVAIAYKSMGLLPQHIISNNVLPKHFCTAHINLEQSASLGAPYQVIWNPDP